MWKDVLETYRCLISNREHCPGTRIEDVFPHQSSLDSIKIEYEWLKQQSELHTEKQ